MLSGSSTHGSHSAHTCFPRAQVNSDSSSGDHVLLLRSRKKANALKGRAFQL